MAGCFANAARHKTDNVVSPDRRGCINGRQHKRCVARELAARHGELQPEKHPEQQKVAAITELAAKKQRQADNQTGQGEQRQLDGKEERIKIPGQAAEPRPYLVWIKPTHEFVTVAACATGEMHYLGPGARQEDGGVENRKGQTSHHNEQQQTTLAQAPASLWNVLKDPIVTEADDHTGVCTLRRPSPHTPRPWPSNTEMDRVRARFRQCAGRAARRSWPAEKEEQQRVFLGDAIKADGDRIKAHRARQQRYLSRQTVLR